MNAPRSDVIDETVERCPLRRIQWYLHLFCHQFVKLLQCARQKHGGLSFGDPLGILLNDCGSAGGVGQLGTVPDGVVMGGIVIRMSAKALEILHDLRGQDQGVATAGWTDHTAERCDRDVQSGRWLPAGVAPTISELQVERALGVDREFVTGIGTEAHAAHRGSPSVIERSIDLLTV